MPNDIVINNIIDLESKKKEIAKSGKENFHVLSDFDKTLTKFIVDGQEVYSLISVLRDRDYLTEDYPIKAKALFEKYHPIEINPKISIEEKKQAMHNWWMDHFNLLIKSGLNKNDIESILDEGLIQFRDGVLEFLDFLYNNKIPLIIFSSTGIGDAIALYLNRQGRLYNNIHIISNVFEWNEDGHAIRIKEPIIHSMNKDETVIQNYSFFDLIENRKNVLLLGDSLEDIGMIKGFDYDVLVKIGFLNTNIEENLEDYQKSFDIVLLNDADFSYINEFLKDIFS